MRRTAIRLVMVALILTAGGVLIAAMTLLPDEKPPINVATAGASTHDPELSRSVVRASELENKPPINAGAPTSSSHESLPDDQSGSPTGGCLLVPPPKPYPEQHAASESSSANLAGVPYLDDR